MNNDNEEAMYSEIWAAFLVTADQLDPQEVTSFVQTQPTESWRKREFGAGRKLTPHTVGGWRLQSRLPLSADLDAHIADVLDQLRPRWHQFVELGRQFDAAMECVVKSYGGDRPAIGLDRPVVQQLAQLNAELDVDLYVFSEEIARRRRRLSQT